MTHGGSRPGSGAKPKPAALKKVPMGLRLPAWLHAWLVAPERGKSAAVLIEEALRAQHGLKAPAIATHKLTTQIGLQQAIGSATASDALTLQSPTDPPR